MTLVRVLSGFRSDPQFMANVAAWQTVHGQPAAYVPLPDRLHPGIRAALRSRGIEQLYLHQGRAVEAALDGRNPVVVTPTASGKTLCYNLPILHASLLEPEARTLYLFPTKALAQDQLAELHAWRSALAEQGAGISVATYDGDTPSAQRARIRQEARLLLTNPDMLHMGILPYHTNWEPFFARLRYVVLDELHSYRGVFGSHVANVLRRLQRVCAFYGSRPQFICTSATIANPAELAGRLIEQPVTLIDENGAPRGEKHIILYSPPIYDAERGLRQSSVLAAQDLAARCVLGGVQTIVFGRSRLVTELLLTYLRERVGRAADRTELGGEEHAPVAQIIRGYRGGYLPGERRSIEAGLRSGAVRSVVATNALELGIDIGQLQAAVLCGYPGSIASAWQQMGRAGRTREASLAILVATAGALDQYVIRHPEFLFERSPEHALINPDNLMLLVDHMRCAAFEAPFERDEPFGHSPHAADVLALLAEQGDVQEQNGRRFWTGAAYPARDVGLRSSGDTVTIQAETGEGQAVIGVIDAASAPLLVHAGALYLHEGQSYDVRELDLENGLTHVAPIEADYYTNVVAETQVETLAEHQRREAGGAIAAHGDLRVSVQALGYRRIKRFTHETLGVFPLDYPPRLLETAGYWISVPPETQAALEQAGSWRDSVNDYGPNWEEQRQRVRTRDGYRCTQCGALEPPGRQHDVHHLIPFRVFGYAPGVNEAYRDANRLSNLVLICRTCHQRLEAAVRVRGGLDGLAYAVSNLAPLYLMCDPSDLGVHVRRAEQTAVQRSTTESLQPPAVFIYERAVAGLGFSARLFELHDTLLAAAQEMIASCPCPYGCPACVGPVLENEHAFLETKSLTLALLRALRKGA